MTNTEQNICFIVLSILYIIYLIDNENFLDDFIYFDSFTINESQSTVILFDNIPCNLRFAISSFYSKFEQIYIFINIVKKIVIIFEEFLYLLYF